VKTIRVVVKHQGIPFDIAGMYDPYKGEVVNYAVSIGDFAATDFFDKALTDMVRRSILTRADKAAKKQAYGGA
jgi:hypothetical protein